MSTSIVVDKCFLQASPASYIRDLASTHRLLVSESLFYELLTTDRRKRADCFKKLPQTENPVDLVHPSGHLIRIELETRCPAGPPSKNLIPDRFEFHPGLTDPDFEMAQEAFDVLEEQRRDVEADILAVISRARDIDTFFSGLRERSDGARRRAIAVAEAKIAHPGSLTEFIRSLPPAPDRPDWSLPPSVDESWAVYRWLQVQFLFAVELFERYRGDIPEFESMSLKAHERLEHDIHDAQGLVLGCLEGAFATDETKLKRWFRLLRPQGVLLGSPRKPLSPAA